MKKIIFTLLILAGTFNLVHAQERITNISYVVGIPMGNTKDVVDNVSFRGISIEPSWFITEDISVGLVLGWQTFYDDKGVQTVVDGNLSAVGKEYGYVNSFPILLKGNYYMDMNGKIMPFIGISAGTQYVGQRTLLGRLEINNNNWHFAVAPEAGLLFSINPEMSFNASARYYSALGTKNTDTQSYIGVNLGFSYIY